MTDKETQSKERTPEQGAGEDDSPSQSLEQQIQDLEADARDKIAAKLTVDKELGTMTIRIKILQEVRKDLATTLPAYEAAYDRLHREEKDLQDFISDEGDKLTERLGQERVEKAENLAAQRERRTKELDKNVKDAREHLERTEKDRDRKKKAVERSSAEYNEWKALTATVTGRQAVIRKHVDEVAKASKEGRYAVAYWLLERARRQQNADANDDRLVRPFKVEEQFREAAGRLATAEDELATAENDLILARGALVAATQERDLHRSTSEAALRLDLEKITQKVP